jgi:hypothetical protein
VQAGLYKFGDGVPGFHATEVLALDASESAFAAGLRRLVEHEYGHLVRAAASCPASGNGSLTGSGGKPVVSNASCKILRVGLPPGPITTRRCRKREVV